MDEPRVRFSFGAKCNRRRRGVNSRERIFPKVDTPRENNLMRKRVQEEPPFSIGRNANEHAFLRTCIQFVGTTGSMDMGISRASKSFDQSKVGLSIEEFEKRTLTFIGSGGDQVFEIDRVNHCHAPEKFWESSVKEKNTATLGNIPNASFSYPVLGLRIRIGKRTPSLVLGSNIFSQRLVLGSIIGMQKADIFTGLVNELADVIFEEGHCLKTKSFVGFSEFTA